MAVEAGSFLVLANHPHRAQEIEEISWHQSGLTRKSLVVWSVGDFLSHRFVSGMLLFQLMKEEVDIGSGRSKARVQCYQYVPLCNLNYYKTDQRTVKTAHKWPWQIKHSPVLHATENVLKRCRLKMESQDSCDECQRAEDYMQNYWGKQFQMSLETGFQCLKF